MEGKESNLLLHSLIGLTAGQRARFGTPIPPFEGRGVNLLSDSISSIAAFEPSF